MIFSWVSWAYLHNIIFLPVVIVIIFLYLYRQYKMKATIRLIAGKWQSVSIQNYRPFMLRIKAICFVLGVTFLFLGLLRPQWTKKETVVAQEGRDVLIALDISRSMLATDCAPDRLSCAKKKIHTLLSMLSCERVGLILFSGSAFLQCPLTTDYDSFYMFLDQVDVETISSGTTAIDAALDCATSVFRSLPARKSKICVLFTDGEDFSSNLSDIKQEVIREKLHVFTVGVGTPDGAPIPLYNEQGAPIGHFKDASGRVVISRLNPGILHALAQDAAGIYVPISSDDSDVKQLVRCITKFEKDHVENKKFASLQDRYHYFLLASLICFILEWVL